jgi:hypothetical protein
MSTTPTCKDCAYVRGLDLRHTMCAHPDAPRNPVNGTLDHPAMRERMSVAPSYCGPNGDGFWPAAPKMVTDGGAA